MYLGIDIGTTSICAVLLNCDGEIIQTRTLPNTFAIQRTKQEHLQDANKIAQLCISIYNEMCNYGNILSLGISGQMHGIVYVDDLGKAISPLYSWQDERGNLPYKNTTYAQYLTNISGHTIATGYGSCSVFYDFINNTIPKNAQTFCTIGDYVAIQLVGAKSPIVHISNAASIGLFDIKNNKWDNDAIKKTNLPLSLFPNLTTSGAMVGKTAQGTCVYCAIGDNQASVFGSTKFDNTVIINIGTGSQISIPVNEYVEPPINCEIRPYVKGKYLLTGCALCGGHSYSILKSFFNSILCSLNLDKDIQIDYSIMNKWAKQVLSNTTNNLPLFNTHFRGTRQTPTLRASICNLDENNFTAPNITFALLQGICNELKDFYDKMIKLIPSTTFLVGTGNAIRLNTALQNIIQKDYDMKLNIPAHTEEASFGASLFAAEQYKNQELKDFIKYNN